MPNDALIVFTAKRVETILELGGTQSWSLSPGRMSHVRYVVCTRNRDPKFDAECGFRPEPHGQAFLVGKVSGLELVHQESQHKWYRVQISEYAHVSISGFWTGNRNPRHYTDREMLRARGIDVNALNWLRMPDFNTFTGK